MVDEKLQVFEDLCIARRLRAVTAVGMLPFPVTRIGDRHYFVDQQVVLRLHETVVLLCWLTHVCIRHAARDERQDQGCSQYLFQFG